MSLQARGRDAAKKARLYATRKMHRGYCPICESGTMFVIKGDWLREYYFCTGCGSIPRQRALVVALNRFFPDWRRSVIHESSPDGASSDLLRRSCPGYTSSQYLPGVEFGTFRDGIRCENLESLTFDDASLDLVITQDVFEHVMDPAAAFAEISRVLRPGGAHVFTMPWYPEAERTVQRARRENGQIEYLEEPVYHGNPVDARGALVTFDWGRDFTDFVFAHGALTTTIYLSKDRHLGLDAEFLEVFISRSPVTSRFH